jgi:predicted permease
MVAVLGNTSYLGFPLVQAGFGAEALPYAVIYDQLGTFLILATYGAVIIGIYGGHQPATVGAICKRIYQFPPFIALCAALLFNYLGVIYPMWLKEALAIIGKSMLPLAMFTVGLQLTLKYPAEQLKLAAYGLTLKMVIAPLVTLFILVVVGQQGMALKVAVLESAMPPMVTAVVMAMASGLAPRFCAAIVSLGMLVAFLWLPLLIFMLNYLFG